MKHYSILLFAIFFGLLSSCNPNKEEGDQNIDVTFIQLNDVYEIAPLAGGKLGGMGRVETIHQELKAENPNTFMFLAGDFLNPSLYSALTFEGEKIKGRQMVEVMNAMNFDLVTFGNHEFDLKEKELQSRLNESNFAWTSANVYHQIDSVKGPFYKEVNGKKSIIPKSYILEGKDSDGTTVKIGMISVTLPVNAPDYVAYDDVYEAARLAYEKVSKETDFVIGLTHLAVEQDQKLGEYIPELKLIMGGHEHANMLVPVGNLNIAKADANAISIYIHKLHYNKRNKKLEIKSTLKKIDDSIASNAEVDKIVSKWQVILNNLVKTVVAKPDEVIYTAKEPLEAREKPLRSSQTNLGKIVANAMLQATNADCAIVNSGSIRIDDQLSGAITAVDIFRTLPYGGAIFTIDVKGDFLKEILEFGESKSGKGAYLQRAHVNKNEADQKWYIGKGEAIDDEKVYKVAITDFLMTGYDIPFLNYDNKKVLKVSEPKPTSDAFDIRKSVINYLKQLD